MPTDKTPALKLNLTESHFPELRDYIGEGSKGTLTAEQEQYYTLLYATLGVYRRDGRMQAVAWLMHEHGASRHVASRVLGEAIDLFYADDSVSRDAWRNLLFQKVLDRLRDLEQLMDGGAATTKDYDAYARLMAQAAKLKRLDQADEQKAPPVSVGQLLVISSSGSDLGMAPTDRRQILSTPRLQQLPARHRRRLEMEVGERPVDFGEILDTSVELAEEASK